jgi:hypothetical protein
MARNDDAPLPSGWAPIGPDKARRARHPGMELGAGAVLDLSNPAFDGIDAPNPNRLVLADHGAAYRLYLWLRDHGFGEPYDPLA